ncbi:MAG: sulfite exporter TauE/SafE family protein [Candidatus Micrarchaeota archaeon]|nr:sulfite exporter TauE/SafE family protein [Candidatus Micrarchaeota archaeon]
MFIFAYWFMFPACILIATIAMLTGISGTAILTPFIILIFPLLGVPHISPFAAIGMALFTEFFGFSSGVAGYYRAKLIDYKNGVKMLYITVPIIIVFLLLSSLINQAYVKVVYGIMMVILALYLMSGPSKSIRNSTLKSVPKEATDVAVLNKASKYTVITSEYAGTFRYKVCNVAFGRLFAAIGAAMEGLTSVGLGELIMPNLIRRCKIPVPVAAATSVFVIAITVLFGSVVSIVLLANNSGAESIPWSLVAFTVPGAVIGGFVGSRSQGKFSSKGMETLIAAMFALIGVAFLYTTLLPLMAA